MATFSQVAKGKQARKVVLLPLGDGPVRVPVLGPDGVISFPASPDAVPLALRPLTSAEQAEVLAAAEADAKGRGVSDPRPGHPLYDLAEMEHTLALCCVDVDSPPESPRRFFDGGVAQIRTSPHLGRDKIGFLFGLFQGFQDEVNPTIHSLSGEEFYAALTAMGGEDAEDTQAFFASLAPVMQWSLARTLAVLLRTSLTDSSASTPPSATPGPSATPTPPEVS
jgi:hypothetical protein